MKLTRRAALLATDDVGRKGRAVTEVADELGCDWHTKEVTDRQPCTFDGLLLPGGAQFRVTSSHTFDIQGKSVSYMTVLGDDGVTMFLSPSLTTPCRTAQS